jgi:hypothetical protein
MQFFLLDLALAFAALLGYRTLEALADRSAPVVVFGPPRSLRLRAAPRLKRKVAPGRDLPPEDWRVSRHGERCERRAPPHRLINLW